MGFFFLGQFKSGIAGDRVAQLFAQCAFLLVVGQLQQIEARRRGGQPIQRVLLAYGEEAAYDAADRVAGVLVVAHLHAPNGERRLQVGESEQRRLRAAGDELQTHTHIYEDFDNSASTTAPHLQEQFPLVLGEIPGQNVPQPADHTMRVVETAVVLRVLAQILQVERRRVAGYQALELPKPNDAIQCATS